MHFFNLRQSRPLPYFKQEFILKVRQFEVFLGLGSQNASGFQLLIQLASQITGFFLNICVK